MKFAMQWVARQMQQADTQWEAKLMQYDFIWLIWIHMTHTGDKSVSLNFHLYSLSLLWQFWAMLPCMGSNYLFAKAQASLETTADPQAASPTSGPATLLKSNFCGGKYGRTLMTFDLKPLHSWFFGILLGIWQSDHLDWKARNRQTKRNDTNLKPATLGV